MASGRCNTTLLRRAHRCHAAYTLLRVRSCNRVAPRELPFLGGSQRVAEHTRVGMLHCTSQPTDTCGAVQSSLSGSKEMDKASTIQRGSIRRGARAVHARCGYWGCSVDPFIQSQSGGMVMPQSPPGAIYNSSPRRPSPGEVVQIPDAVRARCMRGARAVRILPQRKAYCTPPPQPLYRS